MVDLETLELNYFVNMDNVPYELKDGGLIYIKPILVKDYLRYSWAKEILSIEKNEINDIEIGSGVFQFNRELSRSCNSQLNIGNSKSFYGRSLILALQFVGADSGGGCG